MDQNKRSDSVHEEGPMLAVLGAGPLLEVTVELDPEHAAASPQVHIHPGGQGLWVGRMVKALGARVVICGPCGGEAGVAAAALARTEGLELRTTPTPAISTHLIDYRGGDRHEIAVMPSAPLDRHGQDDLYGAMLVAAHEADLAVLTGADPDVGLPEDFFGRLAQDLRDAGRDVVADVSGPQARAVLEASVNVLKISHEELVSGGFTHDDTLEALATCAHAMLDQGTGVVVVSRAEEPALLVTPDGDHLVRTPPVSTRETSGAGDSMTAGIAVGLARGINLLDAVRLGAAAGALNVARRGLGTGRRQDIESFAARIDIDTL